MVRNPESWMIDFSKKPDWGYCQGLVCSAHERLWLTTGDEKFYTYIKEYADTLIDENGIIRNYKLSDYNIDNINSGKILFTLYKKTGDERYKIAMETLRDQMRTHPRTSEGGFWHKKRYPHQMWLDGLYMASPFQARYAEVLKEDSLFNDVANQIKLVHKHFANKGYNGILDHLIRQNEDGTISITNYCAGEGLGGSPYRDGTYEYYINEHVRDDDPKAVGPFIMLALEFDKSEKQY